MSKLKLNPKLKDSLNAILSKFNLPLSVIEGDEVKLMAEGKLADGTIVASPMDSFEVGGELFVVPADGSEPVPAPDGEHTLEDGTIIVVSGGVIAEIREVEVEQPEMSAEIEQVISQLAERVSALESANTELKSQLDNSTSNITNLKSEKANIAKELADAKQEIAKLSKTPAAESVRKSFKKDVATEKVNMSKMTIAERVRYHLEKQGLR